MKRRRVDVGGSWKAKVARGMAKYGPAALRAGYRLYRSAKRMRVTSKSEPSLGHQMTVVKHQFGRNRSTASMLRVLDRVSSYKVVISRFGGMNRCNDLQGRFTSFPWFDATATRYPLHVLELTQRPPDGTMTAKTAFNQWCQATGQPFYGVWLARNGLTNALTPANTQTWEYLSGTNPSVLSGADCAYLEWAKVRFCFRVPTARAGRILIQLVKFEDEVYCPQPIDNTFTGDQERQQVTQFWSHELSGYLYNPIKTDGLINYKRRKVMRVVRQWHKSWEPPQTIEGDPTGNHIRFDIFMRLNQFVDFRPDGPTGDGNQSNADNLTAREMGDGGWGSLNELKMNVPSKIRQRWFLVVKNTNYDAEVDGNIPNASTHLTYDMEAQCKWVVGIA